MKNRLYVLSRRDVNYSNPFVQGGHALAEYLLRNKPEWDNDTLIYLGVNSEVELQLWCDKLTRCKLNWSAFREPDYNNEMTAVATEVKESESYLFSNLKLL